MAVKCPGQDYRWRTVEEYTCTNCGHREEIWSNELKAKCSKCGNWVHKEEVPSCINWCNSARECLGEERWQRLMGDDNEKNEMQGSNGT